MFKKIKNLVVDTTAFIKAANLSDIADNVYTIQEVIDEITNDRQRKKLVVLPYDLKVKDVFTENIKFVTEFSKRTGDYTSLSATDIKVVALTYQLEKEKLGTDHLKTEPTMQKTVKVTGLPNFPQEQMDNNAETKSMPSSQTETCHSGKNEADDNELTEEITEQLKNVDFKECKEIDSVMVKVTDDVNNSDRSTDEDNSDSDEGDWITPNNLSEKKKEMELGDFDDEVESVEVACITSDFAMQNVLKQIGLNVTSVDGRIIRHLRTFIFRCTTCFQTTSVMTKLFCPKCGHSTLKKVSVSIDDEGNQHIHINGRKPLTARGKKFSLPTPRGGQHFQYPILTEDQHIHKNFATKIGRSKTNALDPDYTAGFSPFAMKDVNSKSAVLGVRADKQDIKYWMKHYSKGKKK
ncbi:RNA-binding protein NOB1 [Aricia agestis]|uniref:RNA-binding protein NOB1 n=1 Tax=Aricia agestis TaxID=91739 RepID=UPI001C209A09|nr:RNA-binding protein NOB1 [Aricia agestis]